MDREQALRLVYDAIDVVNRQLPAARRLAKSPETVIVGPSGSLDSLGLVNFVMTLEERVTDVLHAPVDLLDGATLIEEDSPFRTVATLTRFLESLEGPAAENAEVLP
jgi:acyl carrier protein